MKWEESKHPRLSDGTFTFKNGTPAEKQRLQELGIEITPLNLPPPEYKQLCSALKTRYGNNIPSEGAMLYKDYYYEYTYDKKEYLVEYYLKIEIEGNESLIDYYMEDIWKKSKKTKKN